MLQITRSNPGQAKNSASFFLKYLKQLEVISTYVEPIPPSLRQIENSRTLHAQTHPKKAPLGHIPERPESSTSRSAAHI